MNILQEWRFYINKILIKRMFYLEGIEYTATYLPKVPLEQGWNQKQTVDSLIEKAGYKVN